MCCWQRSFKLVCRCHQLLSGFLDNDHLPRVSRQSPNDKGDNEVKPRALHRSPGNCLKAEENHGKPQLGDRLIRDVWPVIASNGVTRLQLKSVPVQIILYFSSTVAVSTLKFVVGYLKFGTCIFLMIKSHSVSFILLLFNFFPDSLKDYG